LVFILKLKSDVIRELNLQQCSAKLSSSFHFTGYMLILFKQKKE